MHGRTGLSRAAIVAILLVATGCGSRGTVSGKVTYQGQALPAGTVLFIHETKGSFSGTIKEDGTYQIAEVASGPVKDVVVPPPALPTKWHGPLPAMPISKNQGNATRTSPRSARKPSKKRWGFVQRVPKRRPSIFREVRQSRAIRAEYTVIAGPQSHDITLD